MPLNKKVARACYKHETKTLVDISGLAEKNKTVKWWVSDSVAEIAGSEQMSFQLPLENRKTRWLSDGDSVTPVGVKNSRVPRSLCGETRSRRYVASAVAESYLCGGNSVLQHYSVDGAMRLPTLYHLLYCTDARQLYHWCCNIIRTNQRSRLRRLPYLL